MLTVNSVTSLTVPNTHVAGFNLRMLLVLVHLISVECLITADTYIYGLLPEVLPVPSPRHSFPPSLLYSPKIQKPELTALTICYHGNLSKYFFWTPPLPPRSQDGARLGRVVSIVRHFIFGPFAVHHPGTFSALNYFGFSA